MRPELRKELADVRAGMHKVLNALLDSKQVSPHLLRHMMATHVRTVKKVPAEAVAYLLHHRVSFPGTSHALTVPEATAYYSRLPVEHLLALLFEAQLALGSSTKVSYVSVPQPRTLQEMDAALR